MSVKDAVIERARRAKEAAAVLRCAPTETKNAALRRMAELLRAKRAKIIRSNAIDMENGQAKGLSSAMLDRLRLDDKRIEDMAVACEEIATLEDPVGEVLDEWTRPNGMVIQKVAVPMGVIGIIYESRPNVTVDAAALCLKAGNTVLLRGGSEAINSNLALADILRDACDQVGLPESCVEIINVTDREAVREMARCDEFLSLIIPRGGHDLIRAVTENATVPTLKHDRGMTQIYVDATCDVDLAVRVVHNSKVQRPGVCNAVENLYVHSANTAAAKAILEDLKAAGVEIRGCPRTCALVEGVVPATEEDFDTEYLDLILSVMMVDSLDEALAQIARHTSGLTECIITDNQENAERFLREVDSAAVYHNVSTRFTDGGQFGLGAEIGISTDKIHARGPVGVRELTTYKYVIRGTGQCRDAADASMQTVRQRAKS
jgi:glutamate-5-semialdehyde dehydrogenase